MTARSPKRDEAIQRYIASDGKLTASELAEKVGVSASQIRKWKSLDKWDYVLSLPPNERKIKKQIGGPYGNKKAVGNKGGHGTYGNQNAKGHGAKPGNTNSLKTGEYATICADALSGHEKELFDSISCDPISLMDENIRLLKIRERRMTLQLNKLQSQTENITLKTTHAEWGKKDEKDSPRMKSVTQQEQLLLDKVLAVEEAISRVQDRLMRAIESKCRMLEKIEEQASALEGNNAPVMFTFNREGRQ